MDIKTYIESGIIENFVLGKASQEESSILQCVMSKNAEVKEAVLEMQETIEMLATSNAVEVPSDLKSQIFGKLDFSKITKEVKMEIVSESTNEPTIRLEDEKVAGRKNYKNIWLAAASILLLIAFGWNMLKTQKLEKSLAESKAETVQNQQQIAFLTNQNEVILNSKNIQLKGVEKHPGMLANVIWDNQYIVHLSVENLPKAPQGKQYQLWAIVDGKPVNVGMYKDSEGKMQEMKMIKSAQAFAITLEKEGGSEAPTMEEMYVMGEV